MTYLASKHKQKQGEDICTLHY